MLLFWDITAVDIFDTELIKENNFIMNPLADNLRHQKSHLFMSPHKLSKGVPVLRNGAQLIPEIGSIMGPHVASQVPRAVPLTRRARNQRRTQIKKTVATKENQWVQIRNHTLQEAKRAPSAKSAPPFPIDAVFTWVDNTPEHEKMRQEYSATKKRPSDNGSNRYVSNDELLYAIRSIYMFAPWFRQIVLIVQDGQRPAWLHESADKAPIPVRIVHHSKLFGRGNHLAHLPTFNSQAIECHLHECPGLAEQFVYFNDDMFIGAPAPFTTFFSPQGKPRYMFTGLVPAGVKHARMNKHSVAWVNNGLALNQVFRDKRRDLRRYPAHQALPMLKSSFVSAWSNRITKQWLTKTSASRFRDMNNVYPIGLLVYWNMYINKAEAHAIRTYFLQIYDHTYLPGMFSTVIQRRPKLFCINDGMTNATRRSKSARLREFFDNYFAQPSPVETKM